MMVMKMSVNVRRGLTDNVIYKSNLGRKSHFQTDVCHFEREYYFQPIGTGTNSRALGFKTDLAPKLLVGKISKELLRTFHILCIFIFEP